LLVRLEYGRPEMLAFPDVPEVTAVARNPQIAVLKREVDIVVTSRMHFRVQISRARTRDVHGVVEEQASPENLGSFFEIEGQLRCEGHR
jgi:hypothetical protein